MAGGADTAEDPAWEIGIATLMHSPLLCREQEFHAKMIPELHTERYLGHFDLRRIETWLRCRQGCAKIGITGQAKYA
jgi:hypothetical protein